MTLFETTVSVVLLSAFMANVPKMFIPSFVRLEKISKERSTLEDVKFLAETFRIFCKTDSAERWKEENLYHAESIEIKEIKKKENRDKSRTVKLMKAECKLNGRTYDFYGVTEK